MSNRHKFLIGGQWRTSDELIEVRFPYTNEVIGEVYLASDKDLEDAVTLAERGFQITRKLPSHRRSAILRRLQELMMARAEELAHVLTMEGGKALKTSRGEVERAQQTVLISSEEARRIGGEIIPIDWTPAGENRIGLVRRFPLGPVLGITPFNYPLNLACHKVAPAIAAGNSIVLKPASATPLSALLLAEMILEAGFPPEAISVVPTPGARAEQLVRDERFKCLTFTGSSEVGWHLRTLAGRKRVALELGGNAAVIIHEDADIPYAVSRCVMGAFTNAGQNCISVQRILIHEPVWDEVVHRLIEATKALRVGDPRDEQTDIGPMIDERAARRAESWLQEAVEQGAKILYGGQRDGVMMQPTILTNVRPDMKVSCQEVFAPLVVVSPYQDFDEAICMANQTEYGLQGGLFTQDIHRIMKAFEEFEVGGLQVNDVSTFRVDHMPYGGVKASGLGREGPRYAIEEMTELKLLVINLGGGKS